MERINKMLKNELEAIWFSATLECKGVKDKRVERSETIGFDRSEAELAF